MFSFKTWFLGGGVSLQFQTPHPASVSSYSEAKMMGPTTRAMAPKEAIAPGRGFGESTFKNQKENHQLPVKEWCWDSVMKDI